MEELPAFSWEPHWRVSRSPARVTPQHEMGQNRRQQGCCSPGVTMKAETPYERTETQPALPVFCLALAREARNRPSLKSNLADLGNHLQPL